MYYNLYNQNQQDNEEMGMGLDMNTGMGMGQDMNSGMGMGQDMNSGMGMGQDMNSGMGMGQDMNSGMGMGQDMNSGMGMGMGTSNRDIFLAEDIATAIIAEVLAYNFYEQLLNWTTNEQDRLTILQIQRDEAKHYHWFTMILRRMGVQLPQIPVGDIPRNFRAGVRVAIRNELEAAAFYQNIAYRATDHHIQMHFMHASHDEQRHATLFQNMLLA